MELPLFFLSTLVPSQLLDGTGELIILQVIPNELLNNKTLTGAMHRWDPQKSSLQGRAAGFNTGKGDTLSYSQSRSSQSRCLAAA